MLILKANGLKIVTRYYFNNNGQDYYQRHIPKDLRSFFGGKTRIQIKITNDKNSLAAEIARLASEHDKVFSALRNKNSPDKLEAEAIAILNRYGNNPGDGLKKISVPVGQYQQPHLTDIEHYFEIKLQHGDLSAADELAKKLLSKPMPIFLSSALEIYLDNHIKGNKPQFIADTKKRWKRLYEIFGDIPLENLRREDAKEYVNQRRRQVKTTSVNREIKTINAVINKVILEKSLDFKNPFESIGIQDLGKDSKPRKPLKQIELKTLIEACNSDLDVIRAIILLCLYTGCRLSEILGLRIQDIQINSQIPHIILDEYGNRTLKTKNSHRTIPLIEQAESLIRELVAKIGNSGYLFPRYTSDDLVKSNSADASINKYIRSIGINKTLHSTRHTVRDLMRYAEIPSHLVDEIFGWSRQNMGANYGEGYSLQQKLNALNKAFEPIFRKI